MQWSSLSDSNHYHHHLKNSKHRVQHSMVGWSGVLGVSGAAVMISSSSPTTNLNSAVFRVRLVNELKRADTLSVKKMNQQDRCV